MAVKRRLFCRDVRRADNFRRSSTVEKSATVDLVIGELTATPRAGRDQWWIHQGTMGAISPLEGQKNIFESKRE